MKKSFALFTVFLLLFAIGCEKKIEIVNPSVTTSPISPYLLDTITNTVIAEAIIDGKEVTIDSYDWEIETEQGELLNLVSESGNTISWIPLKLGLYTIKVTINVDNKSLTEIKQINIEFKEESVFNYLEVEWKGPGLKSDGTKWLATFEITDNGQYEGRVDEVLNGSITAVFNHLGIDSINHPDKTISVYSMINDSTFKGRYSYVNTQDVFFSDLNAIRFRNDFKELYLEALNYGDTIFYNLIKQ